MRLRLTFSGVLLLAGLAVAAAAILAEALGFDPEPGWGRVRLDLLLAGAVLMLAAWLWPRLGVQEFLEARPAWLSALRSLQAAAPSLASIALVLLFYLWFATSGRWTKMEKPTRHHAYQAVAFSRDQLHLPIMVDPRLLSLSDPYDRAERDRLGIKVPTDVSYYHGRYYLYWGPVPGLLILLARPLFGLRVADSVMALLFACGTFLAAALLLLSIWQRAFSRLPGWMLPLCLIVAGMALPSVFLRHNWETARMYQVAIAGAQFFLMAGLLAVLPPLLSASPSAWRLATAGTLWGLALGTRIFLAPSVGLIALLVGVRIIRARGMRRSALLGLLYLGLPLALALGLLAWFNWARFGSVTETGAYYVLSEATDVQKVYDQVARAAYMPANLYNYLAHPFRVTPAFPFAEMLAGIEDLIPGVISAPEAYYAQAGVGLTFTFPFAVFSLAAARAAAATRSPKRAGATEAAHDRLTGLPWLIASLAAATTMTFVLLLTFFWYASRFHGDFVPPLAVLSVLGFWSGYESLGARPTLRRAYARLGLVLALVSILASTLLAFSLNPGLVARLHCC